MTAAAPPLAAPPAAVKAEPAAAAGTLDAIDRALIEATEAGLPLVPRPYEAIGTAIGIAGEEVIARLAAMQATGQVRRIGCVVDHYRLGWTANGMSVWDIDDARIAAIGAAVGGQERVSHCYQRPRRLPDWPYNLFAMVHGRDRAAVEAEVARIAGLIGAASRGHAILYSTRILKKTGLRLAAREGR